jgi:lysozyme family protein
MSYTVPKQPKGTPYVSSSKDALVKTPRDQTGLASKVKQDTSERSEPAERTGWEKFFDFFQGSGGELAEQSQRSPADIASTYYSKDYTGLATDSRENRGEDRALTPVETPPPSWLRNPFADLFSDVEAFSEPPSVTRNTLLPEGFRGRADTAGFRAMADLEREPTNIRRYGDPLGRGDIVNTEVPSISPMSNNDFQRIPPDLQQFFTDGDFEPDEIYQEQQYGIMSPEVPALTRSERLQTFLNDNGAELDVDGDIGPKTRAALSEYQSQMRDIPAGQRLDVGDPRNPAYVEPLNFWSDAKILNPSSPNRSAVREVQSILGTAVDGSFGPNTREALENFQRDNGLEVTGAVDSPETYNALRELAVTDDTNPAFYGTPAPASPVSLVEGSETPWSTDRVPTQPKWNVNGERINVTGVERTFNVGQDTLNIIDISESTEAGQRLARHTPTRIVFHNTAGMRDNVVGFMDYNNFASAQFYISRDGTVYEVTDPEHRGNHASGMQSGSVGIEIEGFPDRHPDATTANTATPEQDAAAALLGEYLINSYPTINQAVSHREIGLYNHDNNSNTPLRPSGKTDGWTALRAFRERVGQAGYDMGTGSNTNTHMGLRAADVGYFQGTGAKPEDDATKQTNRDKQSNRNIGDGDPLGPGEIIAVDGVPVETETPTGAGIMSPDATEESDVAAPSRDELIDSVFRAEGGYSNDRGDTGNYYNNIFIGTNHGISAPVLAEHLGRTPSVQDMRNLTQDEAREIAATNYYDRYFIDLLPAETREIVFHAVYMGGSRGIRAVQSLTGQTPDGHMGPATRRGMRNATFTPAEFRDEYLRELQFGTEGYSSPAATWDRHGRGWTNRYNDLSGD